MNCLIINHLSKSNLKFTLHTNRFPFYYISEGWVALNYRVESTKVTFKTEFRDHKNVTQACPTTRPSHLVHHILIKCNYQTITATLRLHQDVSILYITSDGLCKSQSVPLDCIYLRSQAFDLIQIFSLLLLSGYSTCPPSSFPFHSIICSTSAPHLPF